MPTLQKFKLLLLVQFLGYLYAPTSSQEALSVVNTKADPEAVCAAAQSDCRTCILAHPNCTWCSDLPTTAGCTQIVRCRTASENEKECFSKVIENPQNEIELAGDKPFSTNVDPSNSEDIESLIQLKPQKIDLKLRPGKSQKVNFIFRRVADYPLDLYYVMDLSYSMRDDLATLQTLGSSLADDIKKISNNVRLGFGSFVDKVMMPFASVVPSHLKDPCFDIPNAVCGPVFGFRHQLSLTSNGKDFESAVNATHISGNIDSPEGGFDALMQIAVCQDQIKWRQNSLRVILFTTDASSHIAMDGKLAALLDINDMECHLHKNVNPYMPTAVVYSKSRLQDYPSVGQLKNVFEKNKIQTIFAVTDSVLSLYKNLPPLIGNSFVDRLESDSSNIMSVISNSYNALRDKINFNKPSLPSNIEMSYRVLCPGEDWKESLECDNVSIGYEAVFEFEFRATGCPVTSGDNDVVEITSSIIRDTAAINIEYICDCQCMATELRNNPNCSNSGSLQCGMCNCNSGYQGLTCKCEKPTGNILLEQGCTREIYQVGMEVCSGHGCCECGVCQCNEGFSGDYCQCTSIGCAEEQGISCGAKNAGKCLNCDNNPVCVCDPGWFKNELGLCVCNSNLCKDNSSSSSTECNGRGSCDCDDCKCNSLNGYPFYVGQFCNKCVNPKCSPIDGSCSGKDTMECAVCVYEQDRLNERVEVVCKSLCEDKGILFQRVDVLPDCNKCLDGDISDDCKLCNRISQDNLLHSSVTCSAPTSINTCRVPYIIAWDVIQQQFLVIVKRFNLETDCPTFNPFVIILGISGGIVVLGLIALIVWKIIQTIKDKIEYQTFLSETKKSAWSRMENPLFTNPTIRVENPRFVGK